MNLSNAIPSKSSTVVKVASLIIIFAGAYFARSIITPVLFALFISIICAQPITWMITKRVPAWLALILVAMMLIALFFGFTLLIGGTLSFLISNVSKYEAIIRTAGDSVILFLNQNGFNIPKDQLSTLIQPAWILEYTSVALKGLLRMIGSALLIFLIILFILMELNSFPIKAKAILGFSNRSIAYLAAITQNTRHYLVIKTLVCVINGLLIYIALWIIGVDYAFYWAIIAGLMNFIPNIGSIFATIPAVFYALIQLGLGGAVWTLAAFVIIHNILGNFIEPKIMGRGMGLSTLVVLLSLIFWGYILGPVGMFLSVPFTMTFKIILEQSDKTRWIAVLLGTPAEATIYLDQKEQAQKKESAEASNLSAGVPYTPS